MNSCSNCGKSFPEERVHLHEAYCIRNIRKCQQCDEFVDIAEMPAHIQSQHAEVTCPSCSLKMPALQLQPHHSVCSQRPTYCQYCQLDIPFSDFSNHQVACSARTKQCFTCQGIFTLRNFPTHDCRVRPPSTIPEIHPIQPPPPPILRHQISEPVDNQIQRQGSRPGMRNRSALNGREGQNNQGQVQGKSQKSDKAFLSKKEVAPCLIMKPQKYSVIIKGKEGVQYVDTLPICLRVGKKPPLREINGLN